jgi:hypothetical protein
MAASFGTSRVQRARKRLTVERLVVRLQEQRPSGFLVKGGFALEMRLEGRFRTTRDLDVAADAELSTDTEDVTDELENACAIDARDGFEFRLAGRPEVLESDDESRTLRYSIEARIAGRQFEQIPLEVRAHDLIPPTADAFRGTDLLGIIGIEPPVIRIVPLDYHFADKIHAFTRPRKTPNSRVKDLIDMDLLIDLGLPEPDRLRTALEDVFAHRATHPLPAVLLAPPESWRDDYRSRASEIPGAVTDVDAGFERVAAFFRSIGR